MKTLTIFYDPHCGLCARFRVWLEAQPKRVGVEFLAFDSAEASERFPGLLGLGADREVVVLADDGRWWQGSAAWLTCLWTTIQYYDWAFRLAAPVFQPFVKKAVHLLSENRLTLSRLMRLRNDAELATAIQAFPEARCENNLCRI
ncbi:MAG: DCC1-like thiol-disulfide oxidoreductase family protein [Verrucomicrobiota bacterium]